MWLLKGPQLLALPHSHLSANIANAENHQWERVCFRTLHNPVISQAAMWDKLFCWVTAGQGAEFLTGFI